MSKRTSNRRAGRSAGCMVASAVAGFIFANAARGQIAYLDSFGSTGSGNGQLSDPEGVAVSPDGTVYVGDTGNNRVQYFNPFGTYEGQFGSGTLLQPGEVGINPTNGYVYVPSYDSTVRIYSANGAMIGRFGSLGQGAGQFDSPSGVVFGQNGNLYVADSLDARIDEFDSAGDYVNSFGSYTSPIGPTNFPIGITVDASGNVYTADIGNRDVQVYTANGTYETSIGSGGTGSGNYATNSPYGVAVGANGIIYAADTFNSRILEFNSSGGLVGSFGSFGSGPGQFGAPTSIATTPSGILYVADGTYNRIERLFDPSAWVSGSNNFTNIFAGPTTMTAGPNQNLGTNFTLNPQMSLTATFVDVSTGGVLTQAGGGLQTTNTGIGSGVNVSGDYLYQGGSFVSNGLAVASGGMFLANRGGALNVSGPTTVAGTMDLDGGTSLFSSSLAVNNGGAMNVGNADVFLSGPTTVAGGGTLQLLSATGSLLSTTSVTNSGLVTGSGQITGQLLNEAGGTVAVNAGQNLTITGASSTNAGQINLGGGNLHFTQGLTNQTNGLIDGYGSLRADGAGLNNSGTLSLAGAANVYGTVTNNSTGTIRLTGNQPNVFFGPVINSGSLTVDSGASGSVFGTYSGNGPIVNNGALFLHGTSVSGNVSGTGGLTIGAVGAPTSLEVLPNSGVNSQAAVTLNSGSAMDVTNN